MSGDRIDMVNHPPHYQSKKGLETIDIIEACVEGSEGLEAVCAGNVVKYISRYKKKNGVEDLKKAQWYLNKLIEVVEVSETIKTINYIADLPISATLVNTEETK